MSANVPITVAYADGIGPDIIQEADARFDLEVVEIGEQVYLRGNKAPITTPQGGGYKSLNITARKMLGLYANIRPCVAYDPFIHTKDGGTTSKKTAALLGRVLERGLQIVKTETLRAYNGTLGYTLSQGR